MAADDFEAISKRLRELESQRDWLRIYPPVTVDDAAPEPVSLSDLWVSGKV